MTSMPGRADRILGLLAAVAAVVLWLPTDRSVRWDMPVRITVFVALAAAAVVAWFAHRRHARRS